MTIRIHFDLRAPLAALALLATSLGTLQASAQVPATAPAQQPGHAALADAAPPGYRSALEGYQAYTDEKMLDWAQANNTVARIGGWRAYAKEASQSQAPAGSPQPGSGTAPNKP